MPKQRTKEDIVCPYFRWLLGNRNGVWFADGRSNAIKLGRHSLGTRDYDHARRIMLPQLDLTMAVQHGLAEASLLDDRLTKPLPLEEGRKLYMEHVGRSRVTGGTKASTQKRYRAVLDKFTAFALRRGINDWNAVTKDTLIAYAKYLETNDYAYRTYYAELTILKQANGWLIKNEYLSADRRIVLPLRKPEGTDTYCYSKSEIRAMLEYCSEHPELDWLRGVILALAFTGLWISELASLRWSDVDLKNRVLRLVDETASTRGNGKQARTTKSGRGRSLPIRDDLYEVFRGLPRSSDGFVFHGPKRGRLKPDLARRRLISEVLEPLKKTFPTPEGERGFEHGRLHSFRHFFCSLCANGNIPEQTVMNWPGHRNSAMVRHYYHLHDDEARRHMRRLSLDDANEQENE